MLSDSISDITYQFLSEVEKYNDYPFEYSRYWKEEITEILQKLYKLQFALDSAGFYTEDYYDKKSKQEAIKTIDKYLPIHVKKFSEKDKKILESKYGKENKI